MENVRLDKETFDAIETSLYLLKTSHLEIPNDADPIDWILSGGTIQKYPGTNGRAKDERFGKVCDAYLKDQHQKQKTTLMRERIHISHLKKLLKTSTPIDLDPLK